MAFLSLVLLLCPQYILATEYLSPQNFVAQSFEKPPRLRTLWLNEEHQLLAKRTLGHAYRGLRVRYWQYDTKTAWILDEIGKEKPITIGVVLDSNKIEKITILAFRESRGGEVRHPFFTHQFSGLFLKDNAELSDRIDGISGATMSVRAVSNVSRFALALAESLAAEESGE